MKKNMNKNTSPLDHIATTLHDDMEAVNGLILKHVDSGVDIIPQVARYLISAGGKRVRPLLTLACGQIYGADMARIQMLATSVEFIHTATLLHDDVVDESTERRGQRATNLVFGNQATILVGDFLFSRAFQLMVRDGSLDVLRVLSDASAIITQGEVLQLSAAGQVDTSMDTYIEIIKAKTAALFAASCEVAPIVAGRGKHAAQAMAEYGLNLGIAFQIADDALDYAAEAAELGKTIGDDFREGKITAPVLFALESANDDEKAFWSTTLSAKTRSDEDLVKAQALIAKHDGVEKSCALARTYGEKARLALAEAPDHNLRPHLDALVNFTIDRRS